MLNICGFRIQFDCPVDFSALPIFSPVPFDFDVLSDKELSSHPGHDSLNLENVSEEKTEKPLDVGSLIKAEPCYKIIKNLCLWNPSFTNIVLISSPMGMLGLPFLTREKGFSAKIYATEATTRLVDEARRAKAASSCAKRSGVWAGWSRSWGLDAHV